MLLTINEQNENVGTKTSEQIYLKNDTAEGQKKWENYIYRIRFSTQENKSTVKCLIFF